MTLTLGRVFVSLVTALGLVALIGHTTHATPNVSALVVSKKVEANLPPGVSAVHMATSLDGAFAFIAGMSFGGNVGAVTGSSVYKVDATSGRILHSAAIPAPSPDRAITAMAFDSIHNRLMVAMSSDLFVFDGADLGLIESNFTWNRNLYSLLSDHTTGRLFGLTGPTSATAPQLIELSPVDGSIIGEVNYSSDVGLNPGFRGYTAPRLAMDPAGTRLYALPEERSDLLMIDPTAMTVVASIDTGMATGSLALSPTAQEVFVSDRVSGLLQRFSMTDVRPLGTVTFGGRCPGAIALDALGERAVVGHPCGGVPLQVFDPETSRALSEPFNRMSNGMALWMSSDGRRLYSLSSSGTAFETYEIQTRAEVLDKERASLPLPAAPRGVNVSLSDGTVTITWRPPVNARVSKVKRYVVTGKPGTVKCTSRAPKTTCKISGLTQGRTYAFAVRGVNAAGQGPSEVSAFVTVPTVSTGQPPVPAPAPTPKPEQAFS